MVMSPQMGEAVEAAEASVPRDQIRRRWVATATALREWALANRQEYALAEKHYRAAVESDPRYALAYFDLGNVLDETGRVAEAIQAYAAALQLAPTYADAHYNLALAYEKTREPRKALRHWQAYIKLDCNGPWSMHARNQVQRILQADGLKLIQRRPS